MNAWPFRFNLQEMIPIVFGDRSAVGRHASDLIPMECPSLTRSIRSDPKPVVGNPLHPRPFIASGTCQTILHLVANLQISCLLRCLCSHTYDLLSASTYQHPFFCNQIASHDIPSWCLNMSQQQQHVSPNQNMNLMIHIPCLLQEGPFDAPIPFLTVGDLWSIIIRVSIDQVVLLRPKNPTLSGKQRPDLIGSEIIRPILIELLWVILQLSNYLALVIIF